MAYLVLGGKGGINPCRQGAYVVAKARRNRLRYGCWLEVRGRGRKIINGKEFGMEKVEARTGNGGVKDRAMKDGMMPGVESVAQEASRGF